MRRFRGPARGSTHRALAAAFAAALVGSGSAAGASGEPPRAGGMTGEPAPPSITAPVWTEAAPGLEFARVQALRYCREGSPGVALVRIDPARCRIEPHHESEFPGEPPAAIEGWMERLRAPVVFNAGLYDESRRHLGTLVRDGRDLGGIEHRTWKGMLVAAPVDSLPDAAVLDLAVPADLALAGRYRTAVQSMMLFDRGHAKRVARSDRIAPRTAVAADSAGRIVVAVTEGGYTLWEAADLLLESGLRLTAAIALDGGNESELAVESGAVSYRSYRAAGATGQILRAGTTLPAVVAVTPARTSRSPAGEP